MGNDSRARRGHETSRGRGQVHHRETLSKVKTPVFLLINKAALVEKNPSPALIQTYSALCRFGEITFPCPR